jgi:hypothetical protein
MVGDRSTSARSFSAASCAATGSRPARRSACLRGSMLTLVLWGSSTPESAVSTTDWGLKEASRGSCLE